MSLCNLEIYRNSIQIINDLERELKGIVKNTLQEIKDDYLLKTVRQRASFAKKLYKQYKGANPALIEFYNQIRKERGENIGDQLSDDSGIVTEAVDFLQEYFNTEAITEDHFLQLKERIKEALTKEKICSFLEKELLSLPIEQSKATTATVVPKQKQGAKREYTIKQQSYAFYLLLGQILKANSASKTDIARLLHLLSAKTPPVNTKGNVVMNKSSLYNGYRDALPASKTKYSLEDLKFVRDCLEPFKDQPIFKEILAENSDLTQKIRAREKKGEEEITDQ